MRWIFVLASLLISSTAWADDPAPEEPPVVDEGPAEDEPAPEAPAPAGDEPAATEAKGTPARVILRPVIHYPAYAKRLEIQGSVTVRMFIDADGRLVPRKDPECRWSSLPPEERRGSSFHKRWCVEATSGPKALRADTVTEWVAARFEPAKDASGTAIRSFLTMETVFKLHSAR